MSILIGVGVYIIGMAVTAYLCGKELAGRDQGDAAIFMTILWPLMIIATPFIKLYELGEKNSK